MPCIVRKRHTGLLSSAAFATIFWHYWRLQRQPDRRGILARVCLRPQTPPRNHQWPQVGIDVAWRPTHPAASVAVSSGRLRTSVGESCPGNPANFEPPSAAACFAPALVHPLTAAIGNNAQASGAGAVVSNIAFAPIRATIPLMALPGSNPPPL